MHIAKLHPLSTHADANLERLFGSAVSSINQGIANAGSSVQDYFDLYGNPGKNQDLLRVYGRAGQECGRLTKISRFASTVCDGTIQRVEVLKRGTFYCPKCQTVGKPTPIICDAIIHTTPVTEKIIKAKRKRKAKKRKARKKKS